MKAQIENREILLNIANSDIPVNKSCPIYLLFEQRRIAAQRFEKEGGEIFIDYIEQCNDMIKKYFAIW